MAENLLPEDYEEETLDDDEVTEEEEEEEGYIPGVLFDDNTGDFVRDGRNRLADSTGVESWASWCQNSLLTERYSCLAYDSDYGIDYQDVWEAESREEAESILTRQITDALDADPYGRTAYVSDIEFDWTAPDAVEVTVTVVGIDEVTIDITANLTMEG